MSVQLRTTGPFQNFGRYPGLAWHPPRRPHSTLTAEILEPSLDSCIVARARLEMLNIDISFNVCLYDLYNFVIVTNAVHENRYLSVLQFVCESVARAELSNIKVPCNCLPSILLEFDALHCCTV